MSSGQTIRLVGPRQIQLAHSLIDHAPEGSVVNISGPKRTNDQNSLFWSIVSDISRAKPEGRNLPTEVWKALLLASCGHKIRFEPSLNNDGVVPIGFRSSRLTKAQFSELIEAAMEYATRHNVKLTIEP